MSVSGNSESIDIQSGDCAILMMLINNMKQLVQEILRLCREYGECRVEAERMEEARRVKNALESVCAMARQRLDISDPALLLALLDACEVTRDEGMLQEVLDVVGRNLDRHSRSNRLNNRRESLSPERGRKRRLVWLGLFRVYC